MAFGRGAPPNYNPHYGYEEWEDEPEPGRFSTSGVELLHIFVAMLALALVLWFVFQNNPGMEMIKEKLPPWGLMLAALLVSGLGFVLHELGHKFTAQHFGHWSEFRANWFTLGLGLLIAYLPPHLPIVVPGATWHTGQSLRDQGRISAMGPLVNCAIAVVALPFTFGSLDTVPERLAAVVVFFSGVLATLNLVPIWIFDGRKVFQWNALVWAVMVILSLSLAVAGGRALDFNL